jgi:hypothetical protein
LADKAFDSNTIIAELHQRGAQIVISQHIRRPRPSWRRRQCGWLAIELHDLPAPDDERTPKTPGAGCPVPQETTNVAETAADICPANSSTTSQTNRSDSRELMRRFHELTAEDQQAVIEFLKQL